MLLLPQLLIILRLLRLRDPDCAVDSMEDELERNITQVGLLSVHNCLYPLYNCHIHLWT